MTFDNRLVLALLGSRLRGLLGGSLIALEVTGRHTGRRYRFPVAASPSGAGLVVLPGRPDRKQWWRNLGSEPTVRLLRDGRWQPARATVLAPADPAWAGARAAYAAAHPHVDVPADTPLVLVTPVRKLTLERNPS